MELQGLPARVCAESPAWGTLSLGLKHFHCPGDRAPTAQPEGSLPI
ncbi:MAG: hypothetical protein AAFY11_12045 [Cyanobacteria bacterium J06641_5]